MLVFLGSPVHLFLYACCWSSYLGRFSAFLVPFACLMFVCFPRVYDDVGCLFALVLFHALPLSITLMHTYTGRRSPGSSLFTSGFILQNDAQKKSLSMASLEQKLSGEEMNQLLEEQKREKEEALRKYLELQKKLASDHKRDMELKELEVKILEHRGDDAAVQEKLKKLYDEKKAKIEEKEATEEMN
ncbi:hypothetical protein Tco_0852816 [Tanacetum coccineum]